MQSFLDETVGRLAAWTDHGGRLLQTAAAFIGSPAVRYQATAEALAIHVSTVRYRSSSPAEQFGMDLEHAETRFALALALRLRSMSRSGAPRRLNLSFVLQQAHRRSSYGSVKETGQHFA